MSEYFSRNILNTFTNPTYHIRFYCLSEVAIDGNTDTSSTFQQFSGLSSQNVTIAESGITGYNIASLTIESIVAPGEDVRNTIATQFTMTINEPAGTSFLDAMYIAVTSLGVANWQKCDYYIDISFKGYNEDGSINTNLCSSIGDNSGTWTYQLRLTKIDCDLSTSGSSYTLQGVISAETGLSPEVGRLQANISVHATTLGDFLDGLADNLNDLNEKQYLQITGQNSTDSAAQLISYAFEAMPTPDGSDPNTWIFLDGDDPLQSFRARGFDLDTRSYQTFNLHSGDLISDLISAAVGGTVQGQAYAIRAQDGQPTNDRGDGTYRATGYMRVYPQVTHTAYDNATNNYVSSVTYYIKMYKSQGSQLRIAETSNTSNGTAAIADIQSYGGLRKEYDWIYTGLNTEVLDFSSKFSFSFQQGLPFQAGFLANTENYEQHAGFNTYIGQVAQMQQADSAIDAAAVQQNQNNITQNQNQTTIGGGKATSTVVTSQTNTVYAEDVVNGTLNQSPFAISVKNSGSFVKEAAGTGTSGRFDRRRAIYASILNQLHSPTTQMNTIDMTIKGDPFWLGMAYSTMINQAQNATDKALPNFSLGDQTFIMYFRYPYGQDKNSENIGLPLIKDDNVFSGLYRATNITHVFDNGVFKQTLKNAIRVASVTPQQAIQISKQAAQNGGSSSQS